MEIFGFEIKKKLEKQREKAEKGKNIKSFVPEHEEEDVQTIAAGGYFGQYYDIYGTGNTSDKDLLLKYRSAAEQPEVDNAISDIVNEAISINDTDSPAYLSMENLEMYDETKNMIRDEFEKILRMLNFNENASELFRRWYIDGRLYFHVVTDTNNLKEGIQELRMIDPMKIKKMREVETVTDEKTGARIREVKDEFYVYNEQGYTHGSNSMSTSSIVTTSGAGGVEGIRIAKDAVIRVTSGVMDTERKRTFSHLHKSLKVVNQLRMMEDALVIYRLSRAPERRIFYIDVGNLPKGKAEEYVRKIMSQYRNKLVYDAETGNVKDDRKHMSMLEDFWLPRREGGRGTEIDTLPGGENLGQIDDIEFFRRKLYKSLNVPESRLEPDTQFTTGRATEISRDELKFQKFIARLRTKFSYLLMDALKIQLQLRGIVSEEDWENISQDITVHFTHDNHFYELKDYEIIQDRMGIMRDMSEYVGTYFSHNWIRKNVLRMTDEEIDKVKKEIEEEKESGEIPKEEEGGSRGMRF